MKATLEINLLTEPRLLNVLTVNRTLPSPFQKLRILG
jgi:hypothetical protein